MLPANLPSNRMVGRLGGLSPTGVFPTLALMTDAPTTLTHWGAFSAGVESGDIASVAPLDRRRRPVTAAGQPARRHPAFGRASPRPAVRRGWLDDGPGPSTRRGADEFVAVSWDELTELLAGELRRVVDTYGNEAVYGGSYGWASAGRFHHAQSQLHRFLKLLGGYTFSRHSYSLGATGVIMPRIVGTHNDLFEAVDRVGGHRRHTDLLVCFGGLALKNAAVNHGGPTGHPARDASARGSATAGDASCRSAPLRDDLDGRLRMACAGARHRHRGHAGAGPRADPPRGWHDREFLDRTASATTGSSATCSASTTAWPKSPQWAAESAGLAADDLRRSPGAWRRRRTIVTVSWSLQRVRSRRAGAVDGPDAGRDARARSAFPAAVSASATAR